MKDWFAAGGPAVLDVRVNRMELVIPHRIEAARVVSTALFGIKAVLDGRTARWFRYCTTTSSGEPPVEGLL